MAARTRAVAIRRRLYVIGKLLWIQVPGVILVGVLGRPRVVLAVLQPHLVLAVPHASVHLRLLDTDDFAVRGGAASIVTPITRLTITTKFVFPSSNFRFLFLFLGFSLEAEN